MELYSLFKQSKDGERLFHALVSATWHKSATLKQLRLKYLNSHSPYLLLPHFLKPRIAEGWYQELQSAPRRVRYVRFGMWRFPPFWPVHCEGRIEGRWERVQEEYLMVGQLVQSLFLSDFFLKYLQHMTGLSTPLVCIGGHHKKMGVGDWLNPHGDDPATREITAIYYLTKRWKSSYGGRLCIGCWEKPLFRLTPGFNQLLVLKLEDTLFHGIEKLHSAARKHSRYSSVFWFCEKTVKKN